MYYWPRFSTKAEIRILITGLRHSPASRLYTRPRQRRVYVYTHPSIHSTQKRTSVFLLSPKTSAFYHSTIHPPLQIPQPPLRNPRASKGGGISFMSPLQWSPPNPTKDALQAADDNIYTRITLLPATNPCRINIQTLAGNTLHVFDIPLVKAC